MNEIKLKRIEKVDEILLKEVVQRIIDAVNPVKIILFGSYAYGMAERGSDIDILIVVDNIKNSRREVRLKIRKVLREYLIGKDIIVVSPQDLEKWKNVPQSFLTSIVKKGRILYERDT